MKMIGAVFRRYGGHDALRVRKILRYYEPTVLLGALTFLDDSTSWFGRKVNGATESYHNCGTVLERRGILNKNVVSVP